MNDPVTVPNEAPMLFAENIQLRFENERLRAALREIAGRSWNVYDNKSYQTILNEVVETAAAALEK